ncbi:unnamed protein product [Mytilus coruscus]|uniref:Uncharacterized protein n=1 Tax=Mytilus coruscus TaxID=42192 RepID=A0A6J8BXQ6_MYTCO|nr:unnamed protein product [Mytilus coruscus]
MTNYASDLQRFLGRNEIETEVAKSEKFISSLEEDGSLQQVTLNYSIDSKEIYRNLRFLTAADKSSDLVDTVEKKKTILDSKLGELKSELIQEQDSLKRKIKEDVTLKFKGEGNRIKYTFNEELLETQPYPKNPPRQQPAESYGNPAYAQHYQRTQQTALSLEFFFQGVSLAHSTCATTASSKATGERTVLYSPASGHPTATPQPIKIRKVEPALHSSAIVNDKYLDNDQFSICFHDNDHIESFLEQVQYFENCQSYDNFKGVKGRLASHVKYWENIGACPFVLDTIKNGYVIPFIDTPFNMYHTNNRSARQNTEFVTKSIEDLVQIGCVIKVPFQPYVVNPLSVATQKSVKQRLILDMS